MSSDKETKEVKLSPLESGAAGALSGFITRALLQPLDVVKIRFQLQVEATKKNQGGLYYGLFQAFKNIAKQEGVNALWKGLISAQSLTITYAVGQFTTYTFLRDLTKRSRYKESGTMLALCGGISGMIGTIISLPFDVARTRVIAQSYTEYKGTLDVWKKIMIRESVFGLWKGLVPTLLMTVPFAAIQFRIYYYLSDLANEIGIKEWNLMGAMVTVSAGCGAIAGISAKVVVYPLDVLKKRIQITGSESVRRHFGKVSVYNNAWDCIWKVTSEEGYLAWFKGLKPTLVKSGLFSSLVFMFYEMASDAILATKLHCNTDS